MTLIEMILQVDSLLRNINNSRRKIIFLKDIDLMEQQYIAKIIPIKKDNMVMSMPKLISADKRHLGNQLFRKITRQDELNISKENQY